jgi:hypothetical protein
LCVRRGNLTLIVINAAPSSWVGRKDVINNFMKLFFGAGIIYNSYTSLWTFFETLVCGMLEFSTEK